MVCAKVRIRFRKAGDLRLVSHHDLMRTFERMLRRAGLPYRSTSGFNPRPRLIFALSLALGIIGCDEVADLELDADLPADEVRDRLSRQVPPGLEILDVSRIDPRSRTLVRQVTYRIPVPAERATDLAERITNLLSNTECWIERTRPQPRRLDLRPYLTALRLGPQALEMDLRVTPTGAARPEEVLRLLGLADLLDEGFVLERTAVELEQEEVRSQKPEVGSQNSEVRDQRSEATDDEEADSQAVSPSPAPDTLSSDFRLPTSDL